MDTSILGLVVERSHLIKGDRRKQTVVQLLDQIRVEFGAIPIAISVISVMELTHGIERADLEVRRQRRQAFVNDLISDVVVYPVTMEIAQMAVKSLGPPANFRIL